MGAILAKLFTFLTQQVLDAKTSDQKQRVIFSVARITELEIELAHTKKVRESLIETTNDRCNFFRNFKMQNWKRMNFKWKFRF